MMQVTFLRNRNNSEGPRPGHSRHVAPPSERIRAAFPRQVSPVTLPRRPELSLRMPDPRHTRSSFHPITVLRLPLPPRTRLHTEASLHTGWLWGPSYGTSPHPGVATDTSGSPHRAHPPPSSARVCPFCAPDSLELWSRRPHSCSSGVWGQDSGRRSQVRKRRDPSSASCPAAPPAETGPPECRSHCESVRRRGALAEDARAKAIRKALAVLLCPLVVLKLILGSLRLRPSAALSHMERADTPDSGRKQKA